MTQLARIGPPAAGLTSIEVDGCVNLFNPATQRAVILNETASRIWELSTGEHGAEEIIATLADRYGVSVDEIREQVSATLAQFDAEGLLDRSVPA